MHINICFLPKRILWWIFIICYIHSFIYLTRSQVSWVSLKRNVKRIFEIFNCIYNVCTKPLRLSCLISWDVFMALPPILPHLNILLFFLYKLVNEWFWLPLVDYNLLIWSQVNRQNHVKIMFLIVDVFFYTFVWMNMLLICKESWRYNLCVLFE